jgi:hypothetical protein
MSKTGEGRGDKAALLLLRIDTSGNDVARVELEMTA